MYLKINSFMYKQLLNKGITMKQHMQLKTDNGHLRYYFKNIRF